MSTAPLLTASAQARIARLASTPAVHRAFRWLHLQELRLRQWQMECVSIPAPPFGEGERAAWFLERFQEIGLRGVHLDEAGNALGFLREDDGASPLVLLSAHLDTVFPPSTQINAVQDGAMLHAPGASDNGAGLAALLAIAAAVREGEIELGSNILFAANVGEEAEGDLRGMRHLFQRSSLGPRLVSSIALEGAGTSTVVSRGLGSRRFRIQVRGPGGHAWTDAGRPNPILTLATALHTLSRTELPRDTRSTLNVGQVQGGTGVTAIPQTASATIDIRSSSEDDLLLREVQIFRAVEDAVLETNRIAPAGTALQYTIDKFGDRPAGSLDRDAPILAAVRAVDRHLQLRTEERIGSTDANLPLSLGVQAIAMSSGGSAGGVHTPQEWFNAEGRGLALRRILLVLLDTAQQTHPGSQAGA